jgi:hypothetical protein
MKKIICLLVLMFVLLPAFSLSQRKLAPSTRARAQNAKWERLAANLAALEAISKPVRAYYTNLVRTDFDNGIGADVLARLLPSYVKYLKQSMLQRYGVDISFAFSAKDEGSSWLPPQLAPYARALGMLTVIGTGYVLIDEFSEAYIVRDLQQSGFTHDQAVAAAEHITNEGHRAAASFLCSVPDCYFKDIAEFLIFLEAVRDAKDYDPADYDPNEGDIPNSMIPGAGRSFPDDGGGIQGRIIGRPGPGQGESSKPVVTFGPCWVYGPVGVDQFGNPILGWYQIPC